MQKGGHDGGSYGPFYNWGWIKGQLELYKFDPIGSLDFIKSGPRAL